MIHTIILSDPNGSRQVVVDQFVSLDYARVVNGIGAFSIGLLADTEAANLVAADSIIEVWRDAQAGETQLQLLGFVRRIYRSTDENGRNLVTISGPDVNDLLRRKIVGYASGTSQADKTAKSDDMIKAIARENLGSSAGTGRDLSAYGFTVEADTGAGYSMSKAFAWRNVLEVMQEIAATSELNGTPIYFDIVPTSTTAMMFKTFPTIRGADHSSTSGSPVTLGIEFGTLAKAELSQDHNAEVTFAYAGGQGEGSARVVKTATDTTRLGIGPFNRCEIFADARSETTEAGVQAAADAAIIAGRPIKKFGGYVIPSPSFRYGIEWGFGDRLTAVYRGASYTSKINALRITVDSNGAETITARIDV